MVRSHKTKTFESDFFIQWKNKSFYCIKVLNKRKFNGLIYKGGV